MIGAGRGIAPGSNMKTGVFLKSFLLIWMLGVIWAAFFYVDAAENFVGQSSRIVFFHVPTAWVCTLAFLMSCWSSVWYLLKRDPEYDIRAAVAARSGLIFALIATITGSIFAKIMWGSYWNWDPRETSITILLLIYAAYFALRSAVADPEQRAALSAVYAILAFVTVPFLIFVVPRIYWSLHPDSLINTKGKIDFDAHYLQVFLASMAGFTGLYYWIYRLECRIENLRLRRREEML